MLRWVWDIYIAGVLIMISIVMVLLRMIVWTILAILICQSSVTIRRCQIIVTGDITRCGVSRIYQGQ